MGLRRLSTLCALAVLAACSRCPDPLPPETFCVLWPSPDSFPEQKGPCPAPDKASLLLQSQGTDARGAAIEDPFDVLGPGPPLAGHCCYVVQETPPCL